MVAVRGRAHRESHAPGSGDDQVRVRTQDAECGPSPNGVIRRAPWNSCGRRRRASSSPQCGSWAVRRSQTVGIRGPGHLDHRVASAGTLAGDAGCWPLRSSRVIAHLQEWPRRLRSRARPRCHQRPSGHGGGGGEDVAVSRRWPSAMKSLISPNRRAPVCTSRRRPGCGRPQPVQAAVALDGHGCGRPRRRRPARGT